MSLKELMFVTTSNNVIVRNIKFDFMYNGTSMEVYKVSSNQKDLKVVKVVHDLETITVIVQ